MMTNPIYSIVDYINLLLTAMEKDGLIESYIVDGTTRYCLTEKGKDMQLELQEQNGEMQ